MMGFSGWRIAHAAFEKWFAVRSEEHRELHGRDPSPALREACKSAYSAGWAARDREGT